MWAFARLPSWRGGDIVKGHVLKSTEDQNQPGAVEQGGLEARVKNGA